MGLHPSSRKNGETAKNPMAKPRNKDGTKGKRTKREKVMNFGTWNIQGWRGKAEDIVQGLDKMKADVTVLTETKKKGKGMEKIGNYIHIFSGVPKEERARRGISIMIHKKHKNKIKHWEMINENIITLKMNHKGHKITVVGVYAPSEDATNIEKDQHYTVMHDILSTIGTQREIIMMGDMNSRIGKEQNSQVVGKFGENTRNDNGHRLINLCENYGLKILNGFFRHKDIHKYTWHQETRQLKSIIDYIIIRQKTILKTYDTRVFRKIECGSDHYYLNSNIYIPPNYKINPNQNKNKSKNVEPDQVKYKTYLLEQDSIRKLYRTRLEQKLDDTLKPANTDDLYKHIINKIREAAEETLGKETSNIIQKRNDFTWSKELEVQKTYKQKLYLKWIASKSDEDKINYKRELAKFKRMMIEEKNRGWEKKCLEIEMYLGGTKSSEAWKFIRNTKAENIQRYNLPIINMEEWEKHYRHELTEQRSEYQQLSPRTYQVEGHPIALPEDVVKKAVLSMKNRKACGPEGIPAELIKYGPDKLIKMLTYLFQRYVNGENIPEIWKIGWITPIYKKGQRNKCENYRCITVTSTISRIYGKILKNLVELDYEPTEIEQQNGFRAGRSCIDSIFCITQLIEKKLATGREAHLLFVDLTKAYDNVPISKLWQVLERTAINNTIIRAIKNLYTDSMSRVKIGNIFSGTFQITKGLRQGCSLSPTLFKVYLNYALQQWRNKCRGMGVPLTDEISLYTLHFADDQIVIAQDKEDLEYMSRKLIEEYNNWGLSVNFNKTNYMCIGGPSEDLILNDGEVIKACEEYTYLGTKITNSGRTEKEIETRISKGKRVTGALNSILWDRHISKSRKKQIYNSIFKSIVLYGCEVWQMNSATENKLKVIEMDFLRRSAGVSRLDRVRNERIRNIMDVDKTIVEDVKQRQLCWYGHIQRMGDERTPKQILQWTPLERRKRGRPKTTWVSGIQRTMSERNLEPGDWNDRRRWQIGTVGRRRTL